MLGARLAAGGLPAAPGLLSASSARSGGLDRAAEGFEALFLRLLLVRMLPEGDGGLFGGGPAAGVVRGLFVDEVGSSLARTRSLGIADLIERNMKREALAEPKLEAPPEGSLVDTKG